jgi:hypothetical protein
MNNISLSKTGIIMTAPFPVPDITSYSLVALLLNSIFNLLSLNSLVVMMVDLFFMVGIGR